MKVPLSGGQGNVPFTSSDTAPSERLVPGKNTAARGGEGNSDLSAGVFKRTPIISSPLVRLMGDLWGLASRLDGGELLERLADLPPEERKRALFLQMLLAKRKIPLNKDQWQELWHLVKEKALSLSAEGERSGIFFRNPSDTPFFPGQEQVYLRLFRRDEGKGAALFSRDGEKGETMMICLEKGGRSWEFRLQRDRDSRGQMVVYTDDEDLIAHPPSSWGQFRRIMAGYGISVEKSMKSLQADPFFTDIGNREPDHMVDIVL